MTEEVSPDRVREKSVSNAFLRRHTRGKKANKFAKTEKLDAREVVHGRVVRYAGGARPKKPSSASYFPEISRQITKLGTVSGRKIPAAQP